MHVPGITPSPPVAREDLQHIGTGLRLVEAPTEYLRELRQRHGDTFFIDVFGFRLLMLFSPRGLESLYKLPESAASFHQATFDLVGFKTPGELFPDLKVELFYLLLAHKRASTQLAVTTDVVRAELERWGESGEIEIFDAIRTLEQRVGYGVWICPEAAEAPYWEQLKAQFDVLDQERAFVDPAQTLQTIKSGKSAERAALARLMELLAEIAGERAREPGREPATVDFLLEHFAGERTADRSRIVFHNIVNLNQGFLSNLYAAISWVLVHLLREPGVRADVEAEIASTRERHGADFTRNPEALNEMVLLEQVMMESVRLAQSSITLRKVLEPVSVTVEDCSYSVEPGIYIATMLSVTNTQTPDLERFDPTRYNRNQLAPARRPAGKETISTFGHGAHACPAQRFSHHMCKVVISEILQRFDLQARFAEAEPSPRQLGGVARSARPTRMQYRLKKPAV